jgi:hypothetical protein
MKGSEDDHDHSNNVKSDTILYRNSPLRYPTSLGLYIKTRIRSSVMDIEQRKYPYAIHMPSGRFNHGRNKPESGIGVVVAPVVDKLDSSDANNTDHSITITTTSTIVNIAPTLTPFFANCLSSSLSTKNIAIPPTNPKNMGNRYHILEPRFICCSDIFFYFTFFMSDIS